MRRKTTEQFIAESKAIHGDKYNYSKVQYKSAHTKVCIICPIHGVFWQKPYAHTTLKQGCRKCYEDRKRVGIIGVGIMDVPVDKHNRKEYRKYVLWKNMIIRSNDPKYQSKHPTYKGVTVCEEWLTFSLFKKWLDDPVNGYQSSYHLDKDIIVKGNKIYSPEKCCFVPPEINALFTKRQRLRGTHPIGVTFDGIAYISTLSTLKGPKYLGYYHNDKDAFYAYKQAKEQYIKELAESYFKEGKITERVNQALMKYEVEITD